MIFFACKESKKTERIVEIQTEENPSSEIIRKDTLFLSFSPNMTENEFKKAKNKENEKRLNNGKFQILLKDEVLDFSVYQKNKAIELHYSKFFSINELKNNYHLKLFNELFSVFSKKYDYHNHSDFNNPIKFENFTKTYLYYNLENREDTLRKSLTEYGFNKTNYAVFSDSLKTIVIGFSTKKNKMMELLNTSKRPIRNGFKNDNESKPIKREKIEYDDIEMFDFSLSIDYFLTKDFDSIKNVMATDYNKFTNSLKSEIEKSERNRKKIKKNKSEL